jgi:hypothetical protein
LVEPALASRFLAAAIGYPVEVRPVLVVIADEITVDEQTDVRVSGPRGARRWLLRQPSILSSADVRMLQAAAAKPSMWSRAWCRCGGEFIERTRRPDGHRFLGCSNFPACRQTRPLH